ncbi:hypothetical protein [Ensifer sp. ZNC0028]|uniref:hypothetical protein n=1 Tax=Ensifer sp. ZNC0028 TaxID=1339236 RepID=UPI00068C029A|nr:hypothetical protein [Ensifer sp. ZNC0028]
MHFPLQETLEFACYEVMGPAADVQTSMRFLALDRPSAAVMDVQLVGETSVPVAQALIALAIPFVV